MNDYWKLRQSLSQCNKPSGLHICLPESKRVKNINNDVFRTYPCERWGYGYWKNINKGTVFSVPYP
jgi:hypothetical protein